ncbi:putative DNA processing protein DprA [Mycobacterium avium subsp. hominissuis]|uniref:DNA processing protein DprA n=1 Tax=Mycobacterium avium subsp. hominissuis TaxID=439334 RepID=A0AAI8SQC0_MYCAV|nr:putative DNA processing protein DprA [Mycobacterium avium subsp. hominissuis]
MTAADPRALRAWAYLSRVAEPPCPGLGALVRRVGPVEAAERVRRAAVDDALAKHTEARREIDRAAADLELIARRGGRLVTPTTTSGRCWPSPRSARRHPARPAPRRCWRRWCCGRRAPPGSTRSPTGRPPVVGTRAATAYGEQVAGDLVAGLVQRDVAVVSGGAYGIDGAAHRAALDCDGVTVAVLAGGLDVAYPSGHSALLHRIGQHGLLFTEYAPGVRPARYRFLTRNRLVAAMAGATVVVEAGLRSGAANTAAWARALGRVVAAVPGPVTSSASAGCHALLRNGAELITRAEHVVELIGHIGELAAEEPHPVTPLDGLGEAERRVYEALPGRGAATVEQLAAGCGLLPEQALGPLAMLELAGLVRRQDGRWRIVRTAAGPAPPPA